MSSAAPVIVEANGGGGGGEPTGTGLPEALASSLTLKDHGHDDGILESDLHYIKGLLNRYYNEVPISTFSSALVAGLKEIIWDTETLTAHSTVIQRTLIQLNGLFALDMDDSTTSEVSVRGKPSDMNDFLEYKPTEIISDKVTQIILLLCSGSAGQALLELKNLEKMTNHPAILRNAETIDGFKFLATIVDLFVNKVGGFSSNLLVFAENSSGIPSFHQLPHKAKNVIQLAKCYYVRHFRMKSHESMSILKAIDVKDRTDTEWYITCSEMLRRSRKVKRTTYEEILELTQEGHLIAPENPFVILNVMDAIIDCVREFRGQFRIGEFVFNAVEETMMYMREQSLKLLKEFPNSVRINSQISDYYARVVPHRFCDVELAEKCLNRAYELCPTYAKTTHRLGILTRMNKGDIHKSFDWFLKTIELDPTHYNATMECVKNMIGRPEECDVIAFIKETLMKPEASCWTEFEILEFLFFLGVAYFADGNREKTLQIWSTVLETNQAIFRLSDLDRTCGFYSWDEKRISSDSLRLWIHEENNAYKAKLKKAEEASAVVDKKTKEKARILELLFSLMVGVGRPLSGGPNSGPFGPSPTHQRIISGELVL